MSEILDNKSAQKLFDYECNFENICNYEEKKEIIKKTFEKLSVKFPSDNNNNGHNIEIEYEKFLKKIHNSKSQLPSLEPLNIIKMKKKIEKCKKKLNMKNLLVITHCCYVESYMRDMYKELKTGNFLLSIVKREKEISNEMFVYLALYGLAELSLNIHNSCDMIVKGDYFKIVIPFLKHASKKIQYHAGRLMCNLGLSRVCTQKSRIIIAIELVNLLKEEIIVLHRPYSLSSSNQGTVYLVKTNLFSLSLAPLRYYSSLQPPALLRLNLITQGEFGRRISELQNSDNEFIKRVGVKYIHNVITSNGKVVKRDEEYLDRAIFTKEPSNRKCQTCGKRETIERPTKKCSRCKSTYYCSVKCQRGDWKRHKSECKIRMPKNFSENFLYLSSQVKSEIDKENELIEQIE